MIRSPGEIAAAALVCAALTLLIGLVAFQEIWWKGALLAAAIVCVGQFLMRDR